MTDRRSPNPSSPSGGEGSAVGAGRRGPNPSPPSSRGEGPAVGDPRAPIDPRPIAEPFDASLAELEVEEEEVLATGDASRVAARRLSEVRATRELIVDQRERAIEEAAETAYAEREEEARERIDEKVEYIDDLRAGQDERIREALEAAEVAVIKAVAALNAPYKAMIAHQIAISEADRFGFERPEIETMPDVHPAYDAILAIRSRMVRQRDEARAMYRTTSQLMRTPPDHRPPTPAETYEPALRKALEFLL